MDPFISAAEAALDAWMDCTPHDYVLDANRIPELLPVIASHVPNRSPGERMKDLGEMFAIPVGAQSSVFVRMMRPMEGQVHFLFFWKAFSQAARLASEGLDEEGPVDELETLRDGILRVVEEAASRAPRRDFSAVTVRVALVADEVHRTAAMSSCPIFWQSAVKCFAGDLADGDLTFREITCVLLSWLHDVVVWQRASDGGCRQSRKNSISSVDENTGLAVRLHIYDVSQSENIQRINRVLAHKSSPLKIGGAFHAGIEVNGLEWSFGFSSKESMSGVSCCEPRSHHQHHYRQTLRLGYSRVPSKDIPALISTMIEEYPGRGYDLLRRNCCHFADDFSKRLGVGGIPSWVHRLARLGASADSALQAAQAVKEWTTACYPQHPPQSRRSRTGSPYRISR